MFLVSLFQLTRTSGSLILLLFLVVFAESGLLVGFFLPGDSLLFTVGIVAGAGKLQIGMIIAAPGDRVHRRRRHRILSRIDSRLSPLSAELKDIPTRVPRPHSRVLRTSRREDDHLRQVRPDHQDVRGLHCRRRQNALRALSYLQCRRCSRLGHIDDLPRVRIRKHSVHPA